MEGIYAMYYTGHFGSGAGLLMLKSGVVAGADESGGTYDGSYSQQPGGTLNIHIRLTVPPGASLVTGASAGQNPMVLEIPLQLPQNFANGQAIAISTPTGPLNAIFKKIRDLP
jgi:hypothetical protein